MIGNTLFAADLFAGAGGASVALLLAAKKMGVNINLVAVNHWDVAIKTHQANFPNVKHYLSDVGKVDPRQAVPGGYLKILVAGPECLHFSRASGKKAKNRQSRANATELIWWLESLFVENLVIENVAEFVTWGPLDENDKAIKEWAGAYFRWFVDALKEMGYVVEWQVLCAADYGAFTSRSRLCLIATRHDFVVFPRPTHRPAKECEVRPGLKPWNGAEGIIDFSLKGTSIYTRKKKLSSKTTRRIHNGLKKTSGLQVLEGKDLDFIMVNRENNTAKKLSEPLATLCTGNHMYLCEPKLVPFVFGQQSCSAARPLTEPIPTITTGGVVRVADPYLVVMRNNQDAKPLDEPIPTLCTSRGHFWNADPVLSAPVPDTPQENGVDPESVLPDIYLMNISHNNDCEKKDGSHVYSADRPLPTLTTQQEQSVCAPYLIRYNGDRKEGNNGGQNRSQGLDVPISTLDTQNRFGFLEPIVVSYYSNGTAHPVSIPLHTITTKDRFALCQFVVNPNPEKPDDANDERFALVERFETEHGHVFYALIGWIDILFRMLQPHELAAAHSFPKDYIFTGNKEQVVAQIGNSWDVCWGEAIIRAVLTREGVVYDKVAGKRIKKTASKGEEIELDYHDVFAPPRTNETFASKYGKEESIYQRVRTRIDAPIDRMPESLFEEFAG